MCLYLAASLVPVPVPVPLPLPAVPALDVSFLRNGFRFPGLPCFPCFRLPSGNDHLDRPVRVMAGTRDGAEGHNQIATCRSDRAVIRTYLTDTFVPKLTKVTSYMHLSKAQIP
ncbi:hypothetical protein BDP55DRAFT_710829 [Colletotrichum godetiae]|uniref:Uncharacterized protein n=1 Tax=Colletotrichum godetiae TaxID=1209918 RepID=A0AAJ0AVK0_9PEZI|nr:uncharacterized protein BDP55DRAFT_710829 [Colletotrichum godetiae]KAK1691177.1 hypothetical protein BDP55DRAFT_710829 [Colletotrichum godetiae]